MKNEVKTPKTLMEAIQYFSDPVVCFEFMREIRWPSGVACPCCGVVEPYFLATRLTFKCRACKKQFSVKVGTIMEDSPLPLDKWLCAIWLVANCKNGVSSYEVARALGITQKSAWFMLHRIRLAMKNGSIEMLSGTVEADETYIGGKAKNMHAVKKLARRKGKNYGKTAVFGMMERGGRVETQIIEKADRRTVDKAVLSRVDGYSKLFTDAHVGYSNLSFYYEHQVINHAFEYVRGNIHTNCIENFWSLLKRSINGTYVSVDPYHLERYCDEQAFRFNNRKDNDGGRFMTASRGIVGRRITYKELTGSLSAV